MSEPHPVIMSLIGDTRHGWEFDRYLHKEWPQFNSQTRIEYTTDRSLTIETIGDVPIQLNYPYPKPGIKAQLYRSFGRWLKKPRLAEKGIRRGPYPTYGHIFRRTIKLQHFMMREESFYDPTYLFHFMAGYDPLTDTLYVNKGR